MNDLNEMLHTGASLSAIIDTEKGAKLLADMNENMPGYREEITGYLTEATKITTGANGEQDELAKSGIDEPEEFIEELLLIAASVAASMSERVNYKMAISDAAAPLALVGTSISIVTYAILSHITQEYDQMYERTVKDLPPHVRLAAERDGMSGVFLALASISEDLAKFEKMLDKIKENIGNMVNMGAASGIKAMIRRAAIAQGYDPEEMVAYITDRSDTRKLPKRKD